VALIANIHLNYIFRIELVDLTRNKQLRNIIFY